MASGACEHARRSLAIFGDLWRSLLPDPWRSLPIFGDLFDPKSTLKSEEETSDLWRSLAILVDARGSPGIATDCCGLEYRLQQLVNATQPGKLPKC
jgi:hypothetical protein